MGGGAFILKVHSGYHFLEISGHFLFAALAANLLAVQLKGGHNKQELVTQRVLVSVRHRCPGAVRE